MASFPPVPFLRGHHRDILFVKIADNRSTGRHIDMIPLPDTDISTGAPGQIFLHDPPAGLDDFLLIYIHFYLPFYGHSSIALKGGEPPSSAYPPIPLSPCYSGRSIRIVRFMPDIRK